MGRVIEVTSFCCGFADLERGCKIIALISLAYACMLFSLSVSNQNITESHAAFLLLLLTLMLIYGVIERVKVRSSDFSN